MGLNVYGFQSDFKPHLGHQFKVVISGTNSDAQPDITSQLVKSIKLPEMGMNVEKRNYGTTSLGLSVFTFAEQSIDITFTETESFDVLNTFIACLGWTSNQAINHFYIFVEEYDETMLNLIRKYVYTARVCEVGQPSWQRTGSASFIELTVKFLVLSANISDVSTDNKTPFAVVAQAVSPTMDQQADVIGAATDYGEDYASTTEKLAAAEIAYKKDLQKQYAEQKTKENSRVNDAVKQLQEKYQDPNEKVKKTKADLEKAKKEQEEAKKELEDTKKIYDTFMSDETKKEKSESLNNTLKALDASGNPLYKGKTLDNMSSDELKAFLKEYSDGDANINNDMVSKIGNKAYLESLIDLKKAEEKVAKADENAMLAEGRVTNAEADLAAYNEERKKVREQGTPKAQSFGANSTTEPAAGTTPDAQGAAPGAAPKDNSGSGNTSPTGIQKMGQKYAGKNTPALGVNSAKFEGKSKADLQKLMADAAFKEVKNGTSGGVGEGGASNIYMLGNDSNVLNAVNFGYGTNLTRKQAIEYGIVDKWDKAHEEILQKVSAKTSTTVAELKKLQEIESKAKKKRTAEEDKAYTEWKNKINGVNGKVLQFNSDTKLTTEEADKMLRKKTEIETASTFKSLSASDSAALSEILANMDEKAIGGLAHNTGYAGIVAGQNVTRFLIDHKDEVIADLKANNGFLSQGYAERFDGQKNLLYTAGDNQFNRLERMTADGLQAGERWSKKKNASAVAAAQKKGPIAAA